MSSWSSSAEHKLSRLPWLLVILGPALLFGPALLAGEVLYWGTVVLQFVPWHEFAAGTILRGELPLWNPLVGMGAPLLANYQSALLYPPNWIMLIVEPAVAQTWLTMLHLIVAGVGMILLCRRLGIGMIGQAVAGIGFGLSTYLVGRSSFLTINNTAAWLPWVLWAAESLMDRIQRHPSSAAMGRATLLLAGILAMQWLAGHAQTAWYCLLLAFAWVVWRAWGARRSRGNSALVLFMAVGFLLAFSLAAVQLVPTLEYLLESQRAESVDLETGLTYSLWPWRLVGWVMPGLFGHPAFGGFWGYANYWEDALYVGSLAFILAVFESVRALRGCSDSNTLSRFLLGVVLLSLLFALGKNTPIYPFLFRTVPTFGLFQAPTRWSLLAVFSVCLLAARGANAWTAPKGRALYWTRLGTAGAAGMIVFAILAAGLLPELEPSFIRSFAIAGAGLAAVGLLTLTRPERPHPIWSAGLGLFLLSDLLVASIGLNPTVPASGYRYESTLTAVGGSHRIYMPADVEEKLKFNHFFRFDRFDPALDLATVRASGLPNTPMLDDLASANNFDPLLPARYADWIERLQATEGGQRERMLAFMDVGWLADLDESRWIASYRPVEGARRVRWVAKAVAACSAHDALEAVFSLEQDLELVVVVEPANCLADPPDGGPGKVNIVEEGNNRVELTADSHSGGWIVLSDVYYPGWWATIDGERVELLPANSAFRAVWVPPGPHVVQLLYRPASLLLGSGITLLGVLASLALVWVWRRR